MFRLGTVEKTLRKKRQIEAAVEGMRGMSSGTKRRTLSSAYAGGNVRVSVQSFEPSH